MMDLVGRLRAALHETQVELCTLAGQLQALPWLIGALKHIAKDPCERGLDRELAAIADCTCHTCVARSGLTQLLHHRPVPMPPSEPPEPDLEPEDPEVELVLAPLEDLESEPT